MGVEPILRDSHSRVLTVTLRTTSILVVREGVEPSLAAYQAAMQTATTPYVLVAMTGFEPVASWFQTRRSPQTELHREHLFLPSASCFLPAVFWSERPDSNRRSPASDAGAFAATLRSEIFVLVLSELSGGTLARSFLRTQHSGLITFSLVPEDRVERSPSAFQTDAQTTTPFRQFHFFSSGARELDPAGGCIRPASATGTNAQRA